MKLSNALVQDADNSVVVYKGKCITIVASLKDLGKKMFAFSKLNFPKKETVIGG